MINLLIGALIGAVTVIVFVCASEPNYKDLVQTQRDEQWRRAIGNLPPHIVTVEDRLNGGTVDIKISKLKGVRR